MVGLTGSGELHQQLGQRGGEQQALPVVWKSPDDLRQLLCKAHLKQPEGAEEQRHEKQATMGWEEVGLILTKGFPSRTVIVS